MGIRRAKAYAARHNRVGDRIDTILTRTAEALPPMCGEAKRHHWSTQFADLFFPTQNECGCCWFYRGVLVGAVGIATPIIIGMIFADPIMSIIKQVF
jgi:hypothetical protein